jgi:two-component sensor histidine kinase
MTFVRSERVHTNEDLWGRWVAELTIADRELLERVRAALFLAADVARSDSFLLFSADEDTLCVAAHAQPHSMPSIYAESPVGDCYPSSEYRWLWTALTRGQRKNRTVPEVPEVHPEVGQQVWPVLGGDGTALGSLAVFTNAIERERHRRRDRSFQRAVLRFCQMVAAGRVVGAEQLPPFREQDGVVFIDHTARYRYLSGQASNTYRRLGYLDDLRGRTLNEVAAGDLRIVQQAWRETRCVFSEDMVRDRILLRSAIPLLGPPDLNLWQRLSNNHRAAERYGALLLIKDVTEPRQKAQELKIKSMMIKEVHHRVKNNLQLLVSIIRMQARRTHNEEARLLLHEAISRILSMTTIHDVLSEGEDQVINLRDIVQQIVGQVQGSMVEPGRNITLRVVDADDVFLRTNKATACALVVNELLLNAVEHGFSESEGGMVSVYLCEHDSVYEIRIEDDGHGLPHDFSLDSSASLGLDIIRTLVQDDLKGSFQLTPLSNEGARAVVTFPKASGGGVSL